MEKKVGESIEMSTRLHLQGAIRRRINKGGRAVPCNRNREAGQSLVIAKGREGKSLVIAEGRDGNPL